MGRRVTSGISAKQTHGWIQPVSYTHLVYNDKEDQALQIAKLAVEIFRGEDVNRNKLKEGRYYVSEYQPVYSSNVEDFIKRQTR